ncbi:MAG: glycosyltransferase family 9 protein, partial [Flavobacteriales bacterium]
GKLDLSELISLIQACDGLVAASTGPLHLAAGLGIASVGLFANEAPIWAERWHPVGANARWLSSATRTSSGHLDIQPSQVWDELLTLLD